MVVKSSKDMAEGDIKWSDGNYAEPSLKDTRKSDEMIATFSATRRKEISWENPDYLDKVHVQRLVPEDMGVRSQVCILEGKASIGPVLRSAAPNIGPSGICICVPKKGPNYERALFNSIPSVVNITVSKVVNSHATSIFPETMCGLKHGAKGKPTLLEGFKEKHFLTKSKSQLNHAEKEGNKPNKSDMDIKPETEDGSSCFGEVKMKLESLTSSIISAFNF